MKRRTSNTKSALSRNTLFYIIFAFLLIWLLISILLKKSPTQLVKDGIDKIGLNATDSLSNDFLLVELKKKDSIIQELEKSLNKYEQVKSLKKAIVKLDGTSLNMRSKASLASDILIKIPSESVVEIIYYDTQTYYLDNKAGKWVKVKYDESEGWVWSNFLLEID